MSNINPEHYDGTKCIEEMISIFGERTVIDFCNCNQYKYIYRAERKNGNEDLEKARWYKNYANKLLRDFETNEDYIGELEDKIVELKLELKEVRKQMLEMKGDKYKCISY